MAALISVIIPCYNHAKYVQRCVESIIKQRQSDIEIIVVDDGSTDESISIINNLPVEVLCLQQRNSGPSAARNKGLAYASGKYIAFLDADNVWFDGFATSMLSAIQTAQPDVALVACGRQRIDINDVFIGPPVLVQSSNLVWPHLILSNPIDIGVALIRKEVIDQVSGMDENLVGIEDWDLWIRIAAAGYKFICINEVLLGYRVIPNSVSHNIDGMFRNSIKLLDKAFSRVSLPPSAHAVRNKSYAWRYLDACAGFYENYEDQEAESYLKAGVAIWPDLLSDRHTLYSLVCARQPVAYKTSRYYLDLEEAEYRVRQLLLSFKFSHPSRIRLSMGELYHVLAKMAYVQKKSNLTRRFAFQAIQKNPHCQFYESIKLIVKSTRLR